MKIPAALLVQDVRAYSRSGSEKKHAFHAAGRRFLKELARALHLPMGSFEVRSNLAGIAVSGEVTLHGERLYVQLSESAVCNPGISALYRSCKGRHDYTGGANHFVRMDELREPGRLPRWLEELRSLDARYV